LGTILRQKTINFDKQSETKTTLRLLQKELEKDWGAQQSKTGFFRIMIQSMDFKEGSLVFRVSIFCYGYQVANWSFPGGGVLAIRKRLITADTAKSRAPFIFTTYQE
jgi:hypothetical protein